MTAIRWIVFLAGSLILLLGPGLTQTTPVRTDPSRPNPQAPEASSREAAEAATQTPALSAKPGSPIRRATRGPTGGRSDFCGTPRRHSPNRLPCAWALFLGSGLNPGAKPSPSAAAFSGSASRTPAMACLPGARFFSPPASETRATQRAKCPNLSPHFSPADEAKVWLGENRGREAVKRPWRDDVAKMATRQTWRRMPHRGSPIGRRGFGAARWAV